jgi:hypothetical protein
MFQGWILPTGGCKQPLPNHELTKLSFDLLIEMPSAPEAGELKKISQGGRAACTRWLANMQSWKD